MTITLGLIARDCADDLRRLIRSVRPYVSEIIVADTGSKDKTREVAIQEGADTVLDASNLLDSDGYLTSFSGARQLTLDSSSSDWYMWLDSDDEYAAANQIPSIVQRLQEERSKTDQAIAGCLDYAYSWQNGRCTQRFKRERFICKADGWKWIRPVHEALQTDKTTTFLDFSACGEIKHLSHTSFDQRNGTDRNWRILQRWEQSAETDIDKKTVFYYLGDEHLMRQNFALAAKYFKQCIDTRAEFVWQERAVYRYLMCLHNLKLNSLILQESSVYDSMIQNCHSMLVISCAAEPAIRPRLVTQAMNLPLLAGEDPEVVRYLST